MKKGDKTKIEGKVSKRNEGNEGRTVGTMNEEQKYIKRVCCA